jgi:hypothetical protein
MRDTIRKILKEEDFSKTEIKKMIGDEFEKKIKSTTFKDAVKDIVRTQLGNDKKTEKEVAKITQKVLVKLYKTFWTRRSFWSNNLESI